MLDSLVELILRLIRLVHIPGHATLHESAGMINSRIYNSVLDSFRHNVFRVFLRVEVQLDADIGKGYTGVC